MASGTFSKMSILNRYYRITRFYGFLKNLSVKTGIFLVILIIIFTALELFLIDTNTLLQSIARIFSPVHIFSLFFFSETLAGILPPDAFIAWCTKTAYPWLNLSILAIVSYAGGLLALYLGKMSIKMPAIKRYIARQNSKHIENLKRWGGIFIFIGAMLPLPHSLISFYAGMVQYNLRHYMFWASFRFLRFYLYALVIFNLL